MHHRAYAITCWALISHHSPPCAAGACHHDGGGIQSSVENNLKQVDGVGHQHKYQQQSGISQPCVSNLDQWSAISWF